MADFAYDDVYRSTFSLDISRSTSTKRTKAFALLVIVLLLVLCTSSLRGSYHALVLMLVL